jgi:hypothetical protein
MNVYRRTLKMPVYQKRVLDSQTLSNTGLLLDLNLCGLVTLLDTVFFANGGSYKNGGKEGLSKEWKDLSVSVFAILNSLCLINVKCVHDWLANADHNTELFHLMMFWLTYFAERPTEESYDTIVEEIVPLIGYV